jgi:hypothetical protein
VDAVARGATITGRCRICGIQGKLTYEHVPAREAYNREPLKSYKLDQWWELQAGQPASYRSEQRGAGEYALCESCNNNTGSWYVPELCVWVEAGATVTRSFPVSNESGVDKVISACMKLIGTYPVRFVKEVVAMLLALNEPEFGDFYGDLREFVRERERQGLPDRYRPYLSLFDRDVARQVGLYTALRGIGTESSHAFEATELSYPPFSYVLTIDEEPEEERLGEITALARHGYNQQVPELELRLAVNWTLLPDTI